MPMTRVDAERAAGDREARCRGRAELLRKHAVEARTGGAA